MLPKTLLVAILFATYIDRSFEVAKYKIIPCGTDQECVDTVNGDEELKHGMVIFLVTDNKDSETENIFLRFFDDKPIPTIIKVNVTYSQNRVTAAYLRRRSIKEVAYPFVSAMNDSRVIRKVVHKGNLEELEDFLRIAINPTGNLAPKYKEFSSDVIKKMKQYKAGIEKTLEKRKRQKENMSNAQISKIREPVEDTPLMDSLQSEDTDNWDFDTFDQTDLPAATTAQETGQTSPSLASPEEHRSKRRRGKGPA